MLPKTPAGGEGSEHLPQYPPATFGCTNMCMAHYTCFSNWGLTTPIVTFWLTPWTVPFSVHQKQVSAVTVEIEVCVHCKTNVSHQISSTRQTSNNVDDERRVDLGLSETPFKDRYCNHVRDFNNEIPTRLNFPNMCAILKVTTKSVILNGQLLSSLW